MNKYISLSILLGLTIVTVTACGFQPMYGRNSVKDASTSSGTTSVAAQLSQIDIAIIPDRKGQTLRNNLIDRFYHGGYPSAPIATLKVERITEARTELDLTKSSDATRAQLRLSSRMNLVGKDGTVLFTRTLQSVTSFNILGSEFATHVTEEAARESALNDLARQIELNLSLYYNSK